MSNKKIQTKINKFEKEDKIKKQKLNPNQKQLFYAIGIIIVIIISIFLFLITTNTTKNQNIPIETTPQLNTSGTDNTSSPVLIKTNTNSTLDGLYATGKPSFIVFAGTYCGHCQRLVPELETEIWDNYSDKANIWINIIDGAEGKTFPVTRIAQGYNPNLSYEEIMGDCSYVPAYVVLDKEGNQILRSCGAEKTIDEMKAALNSQLQ